MGWWREAGEQQDGIVSLGIQFPPCLIAKCDAPCNTPPFHMGKGSGRAANLAGIENRVGIAAGGVRGPG